MQYHIVIHKYTNSAHQACVRTSSSNVQLGHVCDSLVGQRFKVWPGRRRLPQPQVCPRRRHPCLQRDVLHAPHALGEVLHQRQGALVIVGGLQELQQALQQGGRVGGGRVTLGGGDAQHV